MSRRTRPTSRGALVGALAGAMLVPIAASAPALASASSGSLPAIPLDSGLSTASGTWAALAMGRLSDPLDTFWQLFFLPAGAARWRLVTPPGVADNGGLVGATAPGMPLLAGVDASVDLGFSPLAQSASEGRSWSPGLLPGDLARVPDALAVAPGHRLLALLATRSGQLLEASTGDISRWHEVASERSVARSAAGRACGVDRLTAVAATAALGEVLGATCATRGAVGVIVGGSRGWRLAAPSLAGGSSRETTEVVRLTASGGALGALVAARGTRTSLYASWPGRRGGSWRASHGLDLARGDEVTSTSTIEGGGFAVTIAHGTAVEVAVLAGPGGAWRLLPDAPRGTAAVTSSARNRYDALAVDGSKLVDYVLSAGGGSWRRAQVIDVPILYGSSG